MASVRSKVHPVGSTDWIFDENAQVSQFKAQELEDFTFAARNEVEWLNEHMLDIFSKNQVDVTEIFKTPGKLRGKTPRTAKRHNPHEIRQVDQHNAVHENSTNLCSQPLSDAFSTNARQPPLVPQNQEHGLEPMKTMSTMLPDPHPAPVKPLKANTDSGYHGMSEDETDADDSEELAGKRLEKKAQDAVMISPGPPVVVPVENASPSPERATTTEGSFHSAREGPIEAEDVVAIAEPARDLVDAQTQNPASGVSRNTTSPRRSETAKEDAMDIDRHNDESALDEPIDETHSPSQGSSPFEPLVRKSSLTFASLPAPEPWTTKKSMGARVSRTSQLDQTRNTIGRGSYLGRFTGGKSLGASRQPDANFDAEGLLHADEMDLDEGPRPAPVREESDKDTKMAQLHNKSSTQRLHDKINMLGKSQPARPTKSIPSNAVVAQLSYPELPPADLQSRPPEQISHSNSKIFGTSAPEDDDDDWIQPPPAQSKRPNLPKSMTADVMENIRGKQHIGDDDFEPSHDNHEVADGPSTSGQLVAGMSIASPELVRSASAAVMGSPQRNGVASEIQSTIADQASERPSQAVTATTSIGTPASKRNADGPISASKSKLQSIMKTARGLFTSSAGVSAQAKIEALTSPSTRTRAKVQEGNLSVQGGISGKVNEEVNLQPDRIASATSKQVEGRKTRSSTEKEEKRKEQEAKVREQEQTYKAGVQRQHNENSESASTSKADQQAPSESKSSQPAKSTRKSPRRLQKQPGTKEPAETDEIRSSTVNSTVSEQSIGLPQVQPSQLQKSKDLRRPVKPAKEAASKPKPQTIRVGALSQQRMPLSTTALSSSLQESIPPAHASRPGLVKKASNASIQTSASNTSLKSSISSKPKALIAAERKKEQDEKEAQRKLDQKREIERKRAAQQEEIKQQERLHREEVERQRERERSAAAEDPKKAASRQLIEKRRLELAKKEQQQRVPQRQNQDTAPPQEKAQAVPANYRQDLGGARPPSRLHTIQDYNRPALNHPPPNPARPTMKRVLEPEPEEEPSNPLRAQAGQAYQANEGKRRRTEENEPQERVVRPTMAPPIRQSNIRKELNKQSIHNNYTIAPPPASHHTLALLKTSTINQTYQQHGTQQQALRPGQQIHDMAKYGTARPPFADAPNPPPPMHKTPLPKHLAAPPKPASPQFINGENIHLEDIPTDSDSDNSPDPAKRTMQPDWVQSPELRRLIEEQEKNQNADSIFGPPQTPRMEEMFKDRHQRFRNRTSSANWTASGDRLTEEEKIADREARERVRREGGWRFGL